MDDKTRTMMLTLASGVIKKGLITLGATAATHGFISANQTETFVSVGMVLVGLGWSFWNDYGRAIVLSQLEVLKAKSLAQAQQARQAGLPPVTTGQIAAQSPKLTPTEVAKTVATLPPAVQATVAKVLLAAFVLSFLVAGDPAHAQLKRPAVTGNPVADIKTNLGLDAQASPPAAGSIDSAVANFNAGVQKITKDIVDKGIADLNAAITDATNHNDNISLPCWQANLKLLQSLPSQWETPPPQPIGLALGIQIQRDLLNAITGNDATSLKVACAALWGDQLKIVANVGALIGVRIATGGLL